MKPEEVFFLSNSRVAFEKAWIVLKMGAVGRGTGNPHRPHAGTRTKWARQIHDLMREHDEIGRIIDHKNEQSGFRHAAGMIIHHPDDAEKHSEDKRILWLRRSDKETSKHGLWELPGGKVEKHHRDPQHTAEEEAMEECGLSTSNIVRMGHHIDHDMDKVYHGFVGDADHTNVKLSDEHDAHAWLTKQEMEAAKNKTCATCFGRGWQQDMSTGMVEPCSTCSGSNNLGRRDKERLYDELDMPFDEKGKRRGWKYDRDNPIEISHHADHFLNEQSHYGEGSRYNDAMGYADDNSGTNPVTAMTSPAMPFLQAHNSRNFENSRHLVGSIANDYGYDWDGTNMTRQEGTSGYPY